MTQRWKRLLGAGERRNEGEDEGEPPKFLQKAGFPQRGEACAGVESIWPPKCGGG